MAAAAKRKKLKMKDVEAAAERLKNWGKWGKEDHVGTLNYTTADDIVKAAGLVKRGQVISLAIPYDKDGPQGGKTKFPPVGRFNPVHLMLRSGADAYSGVLDKRGIRSADDLAAVSPCRPARTGMVSAISFTAIICGTATTAARSIRLAHTSAASSTRK